MSGDPTHHLIDLSENGSNGQGWPIDENDRKSQNPGRLQLCFGPCTTRILGNDMGDTVDLQKRQVIRHRKGSAVDDGASVRQGQCAFGSINKSQKIMVLRLSGETGQVQLADRQKDPRRDVGQGVDGPFHSRHRLPIIAWPGNPGRAFERAQPGAGQGAGLNRVAAHPVRERVGGVDHMRYPLGADIVGKPFHPAEPTDTGEQRLCRRVVGAASIGKDRIHPRLGQGAGQMRGFGGATKQKEARHAV